MLAVLRFDERRLRKTIPLLLMIGLLSFIALPLRSASAQSVVATIPIPPGTNLQNIVSNPVMNLLYVGAGGCCPSSGPATVYVLDGATNTFVTAVTDPSSTGGQVGWNPNNNEIYLGSTSGFITVIDASTYLVTKHIPVAGCPGSVAVDAASNTIYSNSQCCPNGQCDELAVIAGSTDTVTTYIPIGGVAGQLYVNPVSDRIYAEASNDIRVIDGLTNTIIDTIPGLSVVGVNPTLNQIYACSPGCPDLDIIDGVTNTVMATSPLPGCCANDANANPNTNHLFVPISGLNEVLVIDLVTNTHVGPVPVDASPVGAAVDSLTNTVYILNSGARTVSVISDAPVPATTSTSVTCFPTSVAVNQATTCTATVTDTSPTPTLPTGMVTFFSSASGSFTPPNPCTLGPTSSSTSRCSVSYTPSPGTEGPQTMTATYSGDLTHQGSTGMTSLLVTQRTTSTTVSCSVAFLTDHHATPCTATVADTSPGTPITPSGPIAWRSSGKGTFSPNPCTLSGAGGTATCIVTYTASPGKPLPQTITGTYRGDTDHSGSSGTTPITAP